MPPPQPYTLSCRGRSLNLTADHAALARDGEISLRLRRRSSAFYWQTSDQRQSRHEALCTKRARWHLATFGSHAGFAYQASQRCRAALRSRCRCVDACTNDTLATLPATWAVEHHVNSATRGAGWWRWKPYLILQRLLALADGDVLVWHDYDLLLGHDPKALFCLAQNSANGVAAFHFPCLAERFWTKRELATAMLADNSDADAMLDSAQIYGGLLAFRRTPFSLGFVREWLAWTTRGNFSTDGFDAQRQDAGFVEHRHDQSILSLLAKRHRIKSFPMPNKEHDVRDVWAWDAGYCDPAFAWPLPEYRPNWHYGYIMHYKELGHQRESMRHCIARQDDHTWLPMPDYLESEAELRQLRLERAVWEAQRREKWSAASMRAGARPPLPTAAVAHLGGPPEARCAAGETFGGFVFDGVAHLWIGVGCRGIFRCGGVSLRCGRPRQPPFAVCSCSEVNSLEATRHQFDGKLDPAARFLNKRPLRRRRRRGTVTQKK
jgi:hypothetical protein